MIQIISQVPIGKYIPTAILAMTPWTAVEGHRCVDHMAQDQIEEDITQIDRRAATRTTTTTIQRRRNS